MEKIKQGLRGALVDILLVGGGLAVAIGAGMIFLPAGLMVGGALAIVGAWFAAAPLRGGDG